jgi:hypothetical protein
MLHEFFRFCVWLERSYVGHAVRTSNWLFPTIESFHILGLILVIGSIMWFDFRLLGFTADKSVSQVGLDVMPGARVGFVTSMSSGVLLWTSEAAHLYINPAFRLKMLMLVLIGVNAGVFELITRRSINQWDNAKATPVAAKMAGVLSIVLWTSVVFLGRWIAYAGSE